MAHINTREICERPLGADAIAALELRNCGSRNSILRGKHPHPKPPESAVK